MMTEKITARILQEAQAQADQIVAEAKAAAEAQVNNVREAAEQLVQKTEASAKAGMSETERRLLAVAELDAKKQRLAAKIAVLDEAYAEAAKAFDAMDAPEYQRVLLPIVLRAVSTGREGIAPAANEARIDAAFLQKANEALAAQGRTASLSLLPARDDIDRGVILCEGSMEINLSTAAILRQNRERTQAAVAAVWFPQEA